MPTDAAYLHRLLATRGPVLRAIQDENRRREEIMEEVGIAKSTAYRALKELRENELVREKQKVYELTPYGSCALERHRRTEFLAENGDIINLLGDDVDPELILDSEIVRPEPGAPMKPVKRMEEVAKSAEKIYGLAPVVMERYVEFTNELLQDGTDAEFVIEKTTFSELSERYDDTFKENLKLGADVYVTEACIPCGLLLTESEACLIGYESKSVNGCVVTERRDLLKFVYSGYRSEANALSSA